VIAGGSCRHLGFTHLAWTPRRGITQCGGGVWVQSASSAPLVTSSATGRVLYIPDLLGTVANTGPKEILPMRAASKMPGRGSTGAGGEGPS
jgi:hypothetical protein